MAFRRKVPRNAIYNDIVRPATGYSKIIDKKRVGPIYRNIYARYTVAMA